MANKLAGKLQERLTMFGDPEGDQDMSPATESSHGEEESESMFPTANETTTIPTTDAALIDQQVAASELSPPYSQDPPEVDDDEAMDVTGSEPAWEQSNPIFTNKQAGDAGLHTNIAAPAEPWKPGGWDTLKTREESHRMWNALLDKNFSLKKFGDLFDDDAPPAGKGA